MKGWCVFSLLLLAVILAAFSDFAYRVAPEIAGPATVVAAALMGLAAAVLIISLRTESRLERKCRR